MRYVYGVLTLLVAFVAASFAVSNRTPVSLSIWPAPAHLDCPLYLVVLAALALGVMLGCAVSWLAGGRRRRERRRLARKVAELESDLQSRHAATPAMPQPSLS